MQASQPSYTVRDTREVVRRVEGDFANVLREVRAADPALRALVLTGGFARGEGAVLDGVPQNDYDFVALRGLAPAGVYGALRPRLERALGIHVDLQPVWAGRLPWVARSIFWYETALRGRILWGENLLSRIRIRTAWDLDSAEGLRLLVNRAAGLLLATETDDPSLHRLQAAKGLLAAADAHLLARGEFAPSQTERWKRWQALGDVGDLPAQLGPPEAWLNWAYRFKVDPAAAPPRDSSEAWQAAARAILETVPTALQYANLPSLEAYARRDRFVDHLVYYRRSANVPGARRLMLHPTGRVRVATLRLLEASLGGRVRPEAAQQWLGGVARSTDQPLRLLDALRRATLQ